MTLSTKDFHLYVRSWRKLSEHMANKPAGATTNYRKIVKERKEAENAYWLTLNGPVTITKKAESK